MLNFMTFSKNASSYRSKWDLKFPPQYPKNWSFDFETKFICCAHICIEDMVKRICGVFL